MPPPLRRLRPFVALLVVAAACGGQIAPGSELDPTSSPYGHDDDVRSDDIGRDAATDAELDEAEPADGTTNAVVAAAAACKRPRAARLSHSCPTSCATTSAPARRFASPDELLDFLQTRWIACTDDVIGLPVTGVAFHDGCRYSWLIDGKESSGGTFAVAGFRSAQASLVLDRDGEAPLLLTVAMSECPNQLRVTRGNQITYLMAE